MTEWLVRTYFASNALLYGVIAARTAVNPDAAAASVGITLSSAPARSEFVAAYSGLLFGLMAMFAIFAILTGAHRAGLIITVALYVPILAARVLPPLLTTGRYALAPGTTAIEAVLAVAGLTLLLANARWPRAAQIHDAFQFRTVRGTQTITS